MNKQKRPRVLMLCGGSSCYGAEIVSLKQIAALKERGFPIFCTMSGWNDGVFSKKLDEIEIGHAIIKLGWFYIRKPLWTLDTILHLPKALVTFRKIFQKFLPEIIIHTSLRSVFYLGRFSDAPNILVVHDYWTNWKERRLVKLLDRRIHTYIAVSKDIQVSLENLGIHKNKIVQIYNPILFPKTPKSRPLANSCFTLGIVGQVIETKGHSIAFKALRQVIYSIPREKICLKIFGEGDKNYKETLRTQAINLGISDLIHWEGYQPSLTKIYSKVDCLLVPSLIPESFGLTAVEAGAHSIPVIASSIGALSEIIVDGVTGYLVSPNDYNLIAERIVSLIKDSKTSSEIGQKSCEIYKTKFEQESVFDKLASCLQSLSKKAQIDPTKR